MGKNFIKKIKTNHKCKIKICLIITLFFFMFQIFTPKLSVEADEDKSTATTTENGVELTKSAKKVGENEYRITLKVDGDAPDPLPVDIALMLDVSDSMNDKIDAVKGAIANFCEELKKEIGVNIRLSVGSFSLTDIYETGEVDKAEKRVDDEYIDGKYIGDIHKATNLGDSMQITPGFMSIDDVKNNYLSKVTLGTKASGTNTQAGIWRLGDMLGALDSTHKRYAILFTDGLPTAASGMNCKGDMALDKYFKAAKTEYESVSTNVNKFYSAGIFTGLEDDAVERGKEFLSEIQNVVNAERYKQEYFSEDVGAANKIFEEISDSIINDSEKAITRNSIITDILDEHFILPSIDELELEGIDKSKVTIEGDRKISFDVGNITEEGKTISFKVKGRDPYYSQTDLPTNKEATINYNDSITSKSVTSKFGVPVIDIYPKLGEVCVEKKIDKTIKNDDKFTIVLQGDNGRYIVNLSKDESQTIDFYYRGIDTDISHFPGIDNNNPTKLDTNGFVIAGEYTVTEIVPMNYKKTKIEISSDKGVTFKELKEGEKFNLDYINPNINIRVTNELSNTSYWWDSKNIKNYFPRNKGI